MTTSKFLSPFRNLHTELDQFFQGAVARRQGFDLTEDDHAFELTMDVPGFTSENISISVEGRVLHLKGERRIENDEGNKRYHSRTRSEMSFEETIRFPVDLEVEEVSAEMKDGVLTLRLPKVAKPGAKRITVQPKVK